MKAGARGISLLFASGDSGANCVAHGSGPDLMYANWPAASPYVTSVGGTTGGGGGGGKPRRAEGAVGLSSGGFSDRYARPGWQADAVAAYTASNASLPPARFYNATSFARGRAFPDIAAQAAPRSRGICYAVLCYAMLCRSRGGVRCLPRAPRPAALRCGPPPSYALLRCAAGHLLPTPCCAALQATSFLVVAGMPVPLPVDGTSCAAPTAAGIFGLLNDQRALAGKPPLGFLSPLLYAHPDALHDVAKGSGDGCDAGQQPGWPAVAGWDAVTGLGTPNFKKLSAVVRGLP